MKAILLLLAAFGLQSRDARAFPENVRHGYVNCTACHVNPNGTGQLNAYGRQLSKAIQSHGKFFFEPGKVEAQASSAQVGDDRDPESEFLYGALRQPEWLQLGGDLRAVQIFRDTPAVREARFILMQFDVEAAVTVGKLTLDATLGREDPEFRGVRNPGFSDYFISRRHYLLYQLTDEFHVMAGRYMKPYGILHPNHVNVTKRGLGWDFGNEPYLVQAGYLGEAFQFVAYGSLGRFNDTSSNVEKGGGATASVGLGGTYKLGASYFHGYTDSRSRDLFGPWAILGFTEHFYLRAEADFFRAEARPSGAATWGFADELRLGYEFVQGFHGYVEQQFLQDNLDQSLTRNQVYGVGALYYPRTHWEFELALQQRRSEANNHGFTTYLMALAHYYL